MAKRKKTTRKRRVSMSASPKRMIRRKRSTRRKGLSEFFNASTAMAGAKAIGAGALGGFIAGGAHRLVATQQPLTRYALGAGASFLTYALLGYPMMASGMAGAFTAIESQKLYDGMLNEDFYADPDAINQLPVMMNENGDVITLAQDASGDMVYLNESTGDVTLAEDVYLNEDVYADAGVYPSYEAQY